MSYIRRESGIAELQQHRPTVRAKYTDPIGRNGDWSIEQTVQPRFFSGGANDGRFDLFLKTQLAIG